MHLPGAVLLGARMLQETDLAPSGWSNVTRKHRTTSSETSRMWDEHVLASHSPPSPQRGGDRGLPASITRALLCSQHHPRVAGIGWSWHTWSCPGLCEASPASSVSAPDGSPTLTFHGLDAKRFMKFSGSLGREKGTRKSASASAKCWEGREGRRERKTGQASEL